MPRMGRLLVLVSALMLVAGLFRPVPAIAAGTLPPAKVAAVKSTVAEFVTMSAPSRQTGQPPREADARAKRLLDTVLDIRSVTAAEPLPFSDVGRLNDWSKAVVEIGVVYILAGTRVADLSQAPSDPAFVQRVEKNTIDFAPEMDRYIDAQLGISLALLALMHAHLAATPRTAKNHISRKICRPSMRARLEHSLARSRPCRALD